MTYASDRLYNEAIRRNLGHYATIVKVKEIMLHLPCLTLTDREEVEAKKDSTGNYAAVQMLLDNMRRRENWPEEFIAALRLCEHRKLADELSDAYDRIRGWTNNAAPAPAQAPAQAPASDSTAAATTTVTIHTVPVTTPPHLTQPLVKAPAPTTATSQIAAQVSPPASDLQHVEQVPALATSPEPASQIPPPVVLSSQTSFPTVVSASNVTSTVQQNEVPPQVGAIEYKTPISDTPDGQTTSLTDGNVLSNLSVQASSSSASLSQTTNTYSPSQSSQNSEKDLVPFAVEETSRRLPVQDTNSPINMEPEECSDPTVNETVQRTNTAGMPIKARKTTAIRIPQATPSAPAEVHAHCFPSVSQEYFSKPGILQVPNEGVVMQEEPCSTTTTDLEISRSVLSAEPVQSVNFEHPINPLSFISESSEASSLNQPEEDHYESSLESLMGTRQHELRWSEEPSDENLNSQPPRMLSNTFNPCGGSGNMQHSTGISENQPVQSYENSESVVYLPKPSGRDIIRPSHKERSTTFNYQEQLSNATKLASNPKVDPREEGQTTSHINKLQLTAAAAAVGIGLFVVWKIKH
ncbi:mitochondrial antiviral-signaling protein [Triplophysa dalaica]|uniref:mitochondrial antiviral-signaling protein n=1 Tax=Triplophysa dalaica TaxID=1582913 RepID=UPI0024DF87AB|nr:mitochondrial antiviral-signaling protein [Triplophysa dalaica]